MFLCIAYDCFHTTKAELNGCDSCCMVCKALNIYSLALYRKSLLTGGVK